MTDYYSQAYPYPGYSTAPAGTVQETSSMGITVGELVRKDVLCSLLRAQGDEGIANQVANALEGKEDCLYSDEEIELLVSTAGKVARAFCGHP